MPSLSRTNGNCPRRLSKRRWPFDPPWAILKLGPLSPIVPLLGKWFVLPTAIHKHAHFLCKES